MKRKTLLTSTFIILSLGLLSGCGKEEIPKENISYPIIQPEQGTIETDKNKEETTEKEKLEKIEKTEYFLQEDKLYIIKGSYININDFVTFTIRPIDAKEIKITQEVGSGVTMSTYEFEGTISITGDSELMNALHDNEDNICIKVKGIKNGTSSYELVDYECFDIETKESLGKLSIEELENLKIETEEKNKRNMKKY